MKKISPHSIFLFVIIASISAVNSHAGCMEFQGIVLCDNGDRQVTIGNTEYTTRGGDLTLRTRADYQSDYYAYDHPYYLHCYGKRVDGCYGPKHYYGDRPGH